MQVFFYITVKGFVPRSNASLSCNNRHRRLCMLWVNTCSVMNQMMFFSNISIMKSHILSNIFISVE